MIRRTHLGEDVSALVDGQLPSERVERAWEHVLACAMCRAEVDREVALKQRLRYLAGDKPSPQPPPRLLGSLRDMPVMPSRYDPTWAGLDAWREVDALEEAHRQGRRSGLVLAGMGSAAAIGLAAFGVFGMAGMGALPLRSHPRSGTSRRSQAPLPLPAPTVMRMDGSSQAPSVTI
ncbi:MAG: hypothetical protein HZY75_05935 [Nocardioidaceae bacterium]|nr:MAG: hypothetical protein HZY75_05935 [Nocardioidaceae bacterium]